MRATFRQIAAASTDRICFFGDIPHSFGDRRNFDGEQIVLIFSAADEPHALDMLIAPGCTLILAAAVIEPLRAANRLLGRRAYQWRLVSPDGAPPLTATGVALPVEARFEPDASRAAVVVAASYAWAAALTPDLRARLARAADRGRYLIGVESGVRILADAGLLRGRRVAIHWEDVEEFSETHPEIAASTARYEIDRGRATAAGALPTLDLMLEAIRGAHGYPLALEVSKLFAYDPGPAAGGDGPDARPRISATALAAQDRAVADAEALMATSLAEPIPIPALAAAVRLSERQLRTRFAKVFGASPRDHYLALRLNAARRRLIETREPVTAIALGAGFGSGAAFARAYRAAFGEAPAETRRSLNAATTPQAKSSAVAPWSETSMPISICSS